MLLAVADGLIPVLKVFDLPAPYRPFNPVFQGQLSGDDFTNSSTRQEPTAVFGMVGLAVSEGLETGTRDWQLSRSPVRC